MRNIERVRHREQPLSPEQKNPLQRVFIVNRGEIALRILQACHKQGIGAVVGYSAADANSLAVREALRMGETDDRFAAAHLVPTTTTGSYENVNGVVDSAYAYDCDAVATGYGFLAEKPEAARAITQEGLRFIGPSPEALAKAGDKAIAIKIAQSLGIPTLTGTGLIKDIKQAKKEAKKMRFPIMAKASDAGGGTGNKDIHTEAELEMEFSKLKERFGDVYFERYLPRVKHLEVQIAGDKYGNVVSLGERDCSAQRKFQKVLEESPASSVPKEILTKMTADAIRMAKHVGYENLGTWEFLVDDANSEDIKYYFMESNPRIQVEHPVTEMRTGLDLIQLQLAIEQGKRLPEVTIQDNHVIEVRIYAEKPREGFTSDAGTIHHLTLPTGEGVRFDPGYEEGDTIPEGYDKTIGKIIVTASNRPAAIEKIQQALTDLEVTGVSTNKEFLLWLTDQPKFINNEMTTTFIEQAWADYLRSRMREMQPFLETAGEYQEQAMPRRVDTAKLPQNLTYERKGVKRNYFEELTEFHVKNPETCAFRFGVYEEAGIKLALGFWDFERFGGTMGVEEGNAVAKLFEFASKENLPVVMIDSTGGARQQEGTLALIQMDYVNAARLQYPVSRFYNIYFDSYGGVNASIAEQADTKYIVKGSKAGFTGPAILANIQGKKASEFKAQAHEATDHFWNRNVDIVVDDPREAILRILYEQSMLDQGQNRLLPLPAPVARSFEVNAPHYSSSPQLRFKALMTDLSHFARPLLARLGHGAEIFAAPRQLTNEERLALLMDPFRPTAAEFLSPEFQVFDAISPFSKAMKVRDSYQYPPIIGGFALLEGQPVMVLGQQTQRKKNADGTFVKEYIAPRPEDFRWAREKVMLADTLGYPIILLADTTGGDASEKGEAGGISREISNFLSLPHDVGVPVMTINLGECGSGGGLTFARPLNAAAEFSNASSFVSDPKVQGFILQGRWPTEQERIVLLNNLKDARPEVRLAMRFIDEVLIEPVGGMQTNPLAAGRLMRNFLLRELRKRKEYSQIQIKKERWERIKQAAEFATVPLV